MRAVPHCVVTATSSLGPAHAPGDGRGDDRGHAGVALQRCGLVVIGAHRAVGRAGEQTVERGLACRRLAERRQHLRDVAQEDRVGADHQDALDVEPAPVLVEQERGPVQADRRLAGARAALHDQAGVERGAYDDVLLRGDGGDDVAHLAGAVALELGEQRVGDAAVVGGVDAVGVVEHLVEQVVDAAVGHHEAPAAPQALGIDGGGPVGRRRHVGPPVDHHGVAAGVLDVTPADVPGLVVVAVEAPEAQPRHVVVEAGQPVLEVRLGDGRVDGPGCRVGQVRRPGGPGAHRCQAAVGVVDVGLLGREVGVGHRGSPSARAARSVRLDRRGRRR